MHGPCRRFDKLSTEPEGPPGGCVAAPYGEAQDVTIKPVQILIYNTRETIITRAYVKGFVIHPIEDNLGLSRGVAGQVGQRR
jgi:hypothetical protein